MRAKDRLGVRGESLAARYLESSGFRVLERNWRCPEGELDIVALDGAVLVAVEVKARRSLDFGHPFEAVDGVKLARVSRLAGLWSRAHDVRYLERRVDVIAVLGGLGVRPVLEHLRDAR